MRQQRVRSVISHANIQRYIHISEDEICYIFEFALIISAYDTTSVYTYFIIYAYADVADARSSEHNSTVLQYLYSGMRYG